MNNPGQYMIHMTNRGSKVANIEPGGVGLFKCHTTAPLNSINKFGLLHYSIPKTIDCLQHGNSRFNIRLGFGNGSEVIVPVSMPLLDYYNTIASQEYDNAKKPGANAGQSSACRYRATVAFDEVLQTSINWSMLKRYDEVRAGMGIANHMLSRISCAVQVDRASGCYNIIFGYRGVPVAVGNPNTDEQAFGDGVAGNTGAPCRTNGNAGNQIAQSPNGGYTFRGVDDNAYAGVDPIAQQGLSVGGDDDGMVKIEGYHQLHLVQVTFEGVPARLQMMMGANFDTFISNVTKPVNTIVTRGRIRLVNYEASTPLGGKPVGMVEMSMSIPPNMAPPSMLYLQLQVPGTKTKILGQSDERGGWAIPTPPNGYMSKYNNFPAGPQFHKDQIRNMPAIACAANPLTAWQTLYRRNGAVAAGFINDQTITGTGYAFDPIPVDALTMDGGGVRHMENFSCLRTSATPSRMVMFGIVPNEQKLADPQLSITRPESQLHKFLNGGRLEGSSGPGGNGSSGFGSGPFRMAQVFTSSLITPNWIYTNTQDATIQTFDIQLLWGDTSEQVEGVIGNPVQFSIIASP